ncbi:MAG: energy-coupling factor transporter ATPase [Clostridia bacterium]
MEVIKLSNVSYTYKQAEGEDILALKNISLTINEGEFIAVIGHNGSGKSTFARVLNGLRLPTAGDVWVYEKNTKDKKEIYEIRKNVGMVFQNPDNQMIATIVEDDIAFGPENLGLPREEIIKRVDYALKTVGMEEFRHATPFKMSGGQKQRIAIAGVLAIMPKVIVFDESTAMLDPQGRTEVMRVAKELNKKYNITIIHITHFMDEVLQADRVLVMNEGEIVADDTPTNIFAQTEMIKKINLSIPFVTDIALTLKELGINVADNITSEEELVESLCQLV